MCACVQGGAAAVCLVAANAYRREDELVHTYSPIITSDGDIVCVRPWGARPDPILPLGDSREPDTLLCPERRLLIRAADTEVLAVGEVRDMARVVT